MFEEWIIRQCAPTLAGMKTGSLFTCPYESKQQVMNELRQFNKRLVPKGLRLLPLRFSKRRVLIYLFRPSNLQRDLVDAAAVSILKKHGYHDIRVEPCVCQLMERFQSGDYFPHEVGLFLGYPPEDVCGFIENRASGHKCAGYWKVYGDEAAAQRTFEKYKKCTKVYCAQWAQGASIERLTVAG